MAALGRDDEALPAYERALALQPDFAEARYNFGLALAALGRPDEAIVQFGRALAILARARPRACRPRAPRWRREIGSRRPSRISSARWRSGRRPAETQNDLGAYLSALTRYEEAAEQFRKACKLRPNFAIAHNNLGNALVALGKHEEAVAAYRAAMAISPTFAEVYANMGSALAELHHPADALPYFERALALNPHLAETHNNRGQAFVALGHLSDARESFVRAIALQPHRTEFYNGLAGCTRLRREDPHFLAMEALASSPAERDETQQTQLHFAWRRPTRIKGDSQRPSRISAPATGRGGGGWTTMRRRRSPASGRFAPAFGRRNPGARAAAGRFARRPDLHRRHAPVRLDPGRTDPGEPSLGCSAAAS